jgi:hypothetical protein
VSGENPSYTISFADDFSIGEDSIKKVPWLVKILIDRGLGQN